MMTTPIQRTIEFRLLTWWHAGTGRGDGVIADAVAQRGGDGLPLLPGRTVKGLIRDACRIGVQAGVVDGESLVRMFGSAPPRSPKTNDEFERVRALEEGRFATRRGSLRFSSARLGKTREEQNQWSAWARSHLAGRLAEIAQLYSHVSSTAINPETRTAQDKSLRTIEVVVPITLYAFVDSAEDTPWDAISESIELFLRGLGSHRNRGFGRVDARLVKP